MSEDPSKEMAVEEEGGVVEEQQTEVNAVANGAQAVPVPVCGGCGAVLTYHDMTARGVQFKCEMCGAKIRARGAGYSEVYLDAPTRQRIVDLGHLPPEDGAAGDGKKKRDLTIDPKTGKARHRLGFWVAAEDYGEIRLAVRIILFDLGIYDEKKMKRSLGLALHRMSVDYLSGVDVNTLPPSLRKEFEDYSSRPSTDDDVVVLRRTDGFTAGEEDVESEDPFDIHADETAVVDSAEEDVGDE